jgi:hypothetical protein
MLKSLLEGPIVDLFSKNGAMDFSDSNQDEFSLATQMPVMDSAGTGCSSYCTMSCTNSCGMSRSNCCR